MSVIDVLEPLTIQGTDTTLEAAAIPMEPWFQGAYESWRPLPTRSARRVERHDVRQEVDCRRGYLFAKRCLDIVGALVAIIVSSPVMFLAAILIKLTDRGPIFYTHDRIGLGGVKFRCVKFRSMVVDADRRHHELVKWNHHEDSRTFKIPNDPRVTWIGRLMRRSSIDELPQLFNVLTGAMSLVGPRPPVPREVLQYTPQDMRRLDVKPGLTCLWQVSGRSRLPFPEQLRLDLQYVEQRNLWLDVKLILRTFPAVLSADGAY